MKILCNTFFKLLKRQVINNSKSIDSFTESEKMSVELFNSLTGDDGSCSSPPPNIIKPQTAVSNISSISSSKVQPLTTGTSGFQSAFLNSISPEKGNENIPVGGASTQRRALQNLPQNTKLVRGPNGQYSLQKVQTIELTVEQQNVS